MQNPSKLIKIEQKINDVEENLMSNIEALEQKYTLLKDQISKFTKVIEDDKQNKEKQKTKTTVWY